MATVTIPTPRLPPLKLFVGGRFVDAVSGKTFPVIQPATEEVVCHVAEADKADVDLAVEAALKATPEWDALGFKGRRNVLLKLADLLQQHAGELATLESFNNGSPIATSKAIIGAVPDDVRYFAGWCDKVDGRVVSVDGPFHVYTRREPIGVCGIVLPWNVPVWALMIKLAPCLAMGNTAVIKPAEQTPLTALRIAELLVEAGVPAGVVNIVPGYGPTAGSAIAHHPLIRKIAFTGSTEVGRIIMKAAAESNLKKVQLELGGKSPLVIFPDADLDFAARVASIGIFSNNGELCTAASRAFVHESVYDKFVKKAAEYAKELTVGSQFNNAVGPLVDKPQFEKVLGFIEKGKQEGATVVCGGKRWGTKGYFVEPTVFANVTDNNTIAREEIFGPVQTLIKFSDVGDLIARANRSEYGLAAGVITNDIGNAFAVSNALKAGTVWVNTYHVVFPNAEFGGFKQSGFGKEGGEDGIKEWTQTKAVVIQLPQKL